jgi:hypothetical protein
MSFMPLTALSFCALLGAEGGVTLTARGSRRNMNMNEIGLQRLSSKRQQLLEQ